MLRSRLTQPTQLAPGATPIPSRPTALPSVWVPWPPRSAGERRPSHGSYHESSPPRKPSASAGCRPSTPESELPTTTPDPVTPSSDQTRSAPISETFQAGPAGAGASPRACGAGAGSGRSRWLTITRATSGRLDSQARTAGPPSVSIAFTR